MSRLLKAACGWTVLMMIVLACSFGGLSEEEQLQTAVAQTLEARQEVEEEEEDTPEPTITIAPTATEKGEPTNTPQPCNDADFVSETVPDGTEFEPNENFTKTWRVKNAGTCTWNTGYEIVFVSGDKMGGPSDLNLTQNVDPGEQVDLKVDLKAPGSEGEYEGIWNLRSPDGEYLLNYISVKIKVVEEEAPAEKADLLITEFSLNPNPPTMGENVHVRVRVKNQGGIDAGGFKMEWYGLDTFADPSCTWNIIGGLVADGSVLMECDFVFASWYPSPKTTIAYVDVDDDVDESNEGNNSASIGGFSVLAP